jgi:hypothetical protein
MKVPGKVVHTIVPALRRTGGLCVPGQPGVHGDSLSQKIINK